MQCPNCAAGVGSTQKFCGECGARLAPTGGALSGPGDDGLPTRPEPATLTAADDDPGADIVDAEVLDDDDELARGDDTDAADATVVAVGASGAIEDDGDGDDGKGGHDAASGDDGHTDDGTASADPGDDTDAADDTDAGGTTGHIGDTTDGDGAIADPGDPVDGAADGSGDDVIVDPRSHRDPDHRVDAHGNVDSTGDANSDGEDAIIDSAERALRSSADEGIGSPTVDDATDLAAAIATPTVVDAPTAVVDAPTDALATTVLPAVGGETAQPAPPPPPPPMAPPVVVVPLPPIPADPPPSPPAPAPPAPPPAPAAPPTPPAPPAPNAAPAPPVVPIDPTPAAGIARPTPVPPAAGHPLFDPVTGQQAQVPTIVNPAVPGATAWATGQQHGGAQPPHPQPGPAHQQPAPSQPGQGYQPGQAAPQDQGYPPSQGYQQPSPYQQGHATPGYQPGHTGQQAYAGQPGQPGQQAYAGQQGYAGQPYGGYVQPEPTAVHGYNPYALEPQPGPYGYGTDDEWDEVPASGGFKLRLMLLPALLTVVAMVLAITQTLIDVTAGSATVAGTWKINDFGTNLTIGVLICAGAALLGALLACFGQRWAAGLAGGAGLSLAGIVVIPLALIDVLSDTVEGSGTLERSLGYWALVATGGLGVLTFLLSLTRSGDDGRAGLDPWVAALGALATVAAVAGPFIPMNGARLDENWDTLPTLFLVARFAHLGLLLLTGVIGFLLVRRYGLGLAIGGALGVGWLLVSSQFDLTDRPPLGSGGIAQASPAPLPPGIFNPGDLEGRPHIVTIAGMALIGFFALVATVMALIDRD